MVPLGVRRPAAQPARLVLRLHRLACDFPFATGRVAAARPVGADRARRVLARLRALASRLRHVPVPRRVPAPAQRQNRAPLPPQGPRLPELSPEPRRAVALDGRHRRGEPAAQPLPGALHPDGHRHRRLQAGRPERSARAARSAARPQDHLLRRGQHQRASQGPAPARRGAAPARGAAAARGRGQRHGLAWDRDALPRRGARRGDPGGRLPRRRRVRRADARGRAHADRAGEHRVRDAVRLVRSRRRDRRRASSGDRLPGEVRRRRRSRARVDHAARRLRVARAARRAGAARWRRRSSPSSSRWSAMPRSTRSSPLARPLVSVVVPSYQQGRFLEQALARCSSRSTSRSR